MYRISQCAELTLSLFFPPRCAACACPLSMKAVLDRVHSPDVFTAWFCRLCAGHLPKLSPQACCVQCALPLRAASCVACSSQPPPWDWARVLFEHEGRARDAVHRMKFSQSRESARALGVLLATTYAEALEHASSAQEEEPLCIPIPLHSSKLLKRGFNPPEILARALSRETGWPLCTSLLEKVRSISMRSLSRAERLACASSLFVYRSPPRPLSSRRVILIDDVVTTTTTLRSAAYCLQQEGFSVVGVCAVSRAML